MNPLEASRSFLGGFFFLVCVGMGKGWGGEVAVCHRFLGQGFGSRVSKGWSIPGWMLGAVREAQGWKREQSLRLEPGQVLQDGTEAQLGWGFAALAGKWALGGHILLL